jgi:hypothetical protein
MTAGHIDGQVLLLAAAKASVGPQRLPDLVDIVQAHLGDRCSEYRGQYEVAFEQPDRVGLFVESGHWVALGRRLGLEDRERDAVERVHTEQFRRIARDTDREDEFDAALDIREAVIIGRG